MDFWFSLFLERVESGQSGTSTRHPNQRREMAPFAKAGVTSVRLCEKADEQMESVGVLGDKFQGSFVICDEPSRDFFVPYRIVE